jgi:carbamoyl-phosphate synthase large subunit
MRPVNVVLMSVGRRVELVRAFRRAYDALGLEGAIIGLDADALAPALRVVDRPHLVPRLNDPDFIQALLDICRSEQAHLVFPLIDPDVPVLAQHRDLIASTGALAVVVDAAAAATVGDKWRTYRWFERIGVPTPPTWLPSQVHPARAVYPVFVKPRRGSASAQCFKARDAPELWFFSSYVPRPIVQPWLQGPEVTNDVICDFAGECLGVVSRQRIQTRSGEVTKAVTVYHPEIVEQCRHIARALGAIGPITVQGMWDRGRFLFTEINARFGGGVPLGIAAGADSPRWLLARAAGLEIEIPPIGEYRTQVHLTRFDDSFIFSDAARPEAASRHL